MIQAFNIYICYEQGLVKRSLVHSFLNNSLLFLPLLCPGIINKKHLKGTKKCDVEGTAKDIADGKSIKAAAKAHDMELNNTATIY